jgi:exonuclease SbcC
MERAALERRRDERRKSATILAAEKKTLAGAQRDLDAALCTLRETEGIEAELEAVSHQLEAERRREAGAGEAAAGCAALLSEVDDKLALLKAKDGECPLCGGPLDAAHRREITGMLKANAKHTAARQKQAEGEREVAAKEVGRLSEESERLARVRDERSRIEGSLDGLRAKCDRFAALTAEIERLAAEHTDDETLLRDGAYAAAWQPRIDEIGAQIGSVYDADEHRAIAERLAALRPVEQLHGRLAAAGERRPVVEAEAARAAEREVEARESLEARASRERELEDEIAGLAPAREAVVRLTEALAAQRREGAAADATVERLGAELEAAMRIAAEVEAARTAEAEQAARRRRYEMLVKAFGRGGIPDRVIGNALPELRDEANDVLGRLSDHEMYVDFRLDRETKSGKIRETFDVLVSYDGGVRDFRMFSGGEAFRIAFAVRLGLSKLLVRRAGARLETLVIDEGFGTQDPTGRERLVEAIEVARREFAKVLVITHLDELKDVFGAQIRVSKDSVEGSRLDICS